MQLAGAAQHGRAVGVEPAPDGNTILLDFLQLKVLRYM
jgi:hypothetical protein